MQEPYYFDYCNVVVSSETTKCRPFKLNFFFKTFFGYSGFLRFHMNFRLDFSISAKKCHQDFDRDCTESIDYFG